MENKNLRPTGAQFTEAKTNKSESNYLVGKAPYGGKKKDVWNASHMVASGNPSTGTASSSSTRNQKPRGSDKRFKSRVAGNTGTGASRKNGHQVNNFDDPDLEDILPEKWKKENLAHLLNMKFQLAPRDSIASPHWRNTHSARDKYHNSYASCHTYSKDHYLQANCQFVVKADRDYTAYLTDPDLLVPWETIEQIRIWGSEVASCPVCLHPPVAARMTRCGHIYCWPCILHFLALSDKASRPCPICDAPVQGGDLKSVVALEQRQFNVGHTIEFRLMKRDRHSLLSQPVHHNPELGSSASGSQEQKPMYLTKAGENHVFSNLLLCTPQDVNEILKSAKQELLLQYEDEKDCPESCFIQQALEQISFRQETDPLIVDSNILSHSEPPNSDKGLQDHENALFTEARPRFISTSSDGLLDQLASGQDAELNCATFDDRSSMTSPQVRNPHSQQKNVFYFYQSNDGQAIFMHSLNVQMLTSQYGSLEFCPEVVEGEIVEVDCLSMNDEVRNRLRYLGHIPISKQFQIVEIALDENLVDTDILNEFHDKIDDRARRRRRKHRDEQRRDVQIQRAEDAKWGRSKNKPIAYLDSPAHFPAFSPTSEWENPSFAFQADEPPSEEIPIHEEHEVRSQESGPSFAQMLREGKTKPVTAWPAPSRNGTSSTKLVSRFRSDSETEPDPDGYAPAPEYRDTFSSALAAAFDQAAKLTDDAPVKLDDNKGKKGKRKVKQKVLFATGMNFM